MINKRFDQINKQDLDDLVANAVSEGRTLEYKEVLPGGTDAERKEFLADISCFANASGGDLVFGVQEKRDANGKTTGVPDAVIGLAGLNPDEEVRRLENIIRDGIKPRIGGIHSSSIAGFPKGPAIVIRIPKSWASPHMITFKSESRFYSRTSAGKYPLDVSEIRSAFLLSETLGEKARRVRDDRLARVVSGQTPVRLHEFPKVVLHMLPVSSLQPGAEIYGLDVIQESSRSVHPMFSSGYDRRINFDGLLLFVGSKLDVNSGYVQIFRSGAIEAVDAQILEPQEIGKVIPSLTFEHDLIAAVQGYFDFARTMDLSLPSFLMLSLLNVQGYYMATPRLFNRGETIDRDVLLLPELLIEEFNQPAEIQLKPAFDSLWQACGFKSSFYYGSDGKWSGR